MSSKTFPYPISKFSKDPINDALKRIAAGSGQTVAAVTEAVVAAGSALAWSDPYQALGLGTQDWQWQIQFDFQPPGADEPNMYIAFSSGNSAYSAGGALPAPVPNFTTPLVFTMMGAPLFLGGGSSGPSSGAGIGGASLRRIKVSPQQIANLVTDMENIVIFGSGPAFRYWYDPQVAAGNGTGCWQVEVSAWASNYVAMIIIESSGCAIASGNGGLPAIVPPSSWAGWTQMHNSWAMV